MGRVKCALCALAERTNERGVAPIHRIMSFPQCSATRRGEEKADGYTETSLRFEEEYGERTRNWEDEGTY